MNRKQAYQEKLSTKLDEWKAEIDKLEAKADQVESEAKIQYYRNVEQLRAQQEIARHKLANLQQASDDTWDDLKSGADIAWKNLGTAVKSAAARFE
jgi:predicted RNase H-like nuclease (RuvC/YqgF family)